MFSRIVLNSLAVFFLLSQTVLASQSAVEYLSQQRVGMFEFGVYKLDQFHRKSIDTLLAAKSAKGASAVFYDSTKERLVLSATVFKLGDFPSSSEACWSVITDTRQGFGIKDGKPLLPGTENSFMVLNFMYGGGKQTDRGIELLSSLERNTVIQCTIWGEKQPLERWGKLLSKEWHEGSYKD